MRRGDGFRFSLTCVSWWNVTAKHLGKILRDSANPAIAAQSQRFFKTGKGEYGEGDTFLGIRVPVLREQAKQFSGMALQEVRLLLTSPFHEERLCALLILVQKFSKGDEKEKVAIYRLYVNNMKYINNWDLVDSSAPQVVGAYLADKDKEPLYMFSQSKSLWERRMAIMATFCFIKKNQFKEALSLSKRLLNDKEDLIQKAVGWMLREIGKRNLATEKLFCKFIISGCPGLCFDMPLRDFLNEREKSI